MNSFDHILDLILLGTVAPRGIPSVIEMLLVGVLLGSVPAGSPSKILVTSSETVPSAAVCGLGSDAAHWTWPPVGLFVCNVHGRGVT